MGPIPRGGGLRGSAGLIFGAFGADQVDHAEKPRVRGFHRLREAAIIRREHLVFAAPVKVHRPHMSAATPRVLPRLSPLRCTLAGVLSGTIALSPLPVLAADGSLLTLRPEALNLAPAGGAAPAATVATAASTGNVVGLFRFGGDPDAASSMRSQVQIDLEGAGYVVKGVALDIDTAADKVKCKGGPDECVGKVVEWLTKGAKGKGGTTYNFLVYGTWSTDPARPGSLVIYDVAQKKKVREIAPAGTVDDLILPLALPRELAVSLKEYQNPPPPVTEAETKILAELDEPSKTPEELRAEADAIKKAQESVDTGMSEAVDTSGVTVDLKKDFKTYCRTGPRKPRVNKDDPKDLRPSCKLGPGFGYFQARGWVALGLTAGALVTTGLFYTLGMVARKPYKDANAKLEASGFDPLDPTMSTQYTALAADVAAKGNTMRKRFVGGDVALLATVLLGAVLGIIIYQDRTDAKAFIRTEKSLKAVSRLKPANFRGGPALSTTMQGVTFGFDF